MTRHLPLHRRARGEEGVALAWALAFMVLIGIMVFFVLGYVTTSVRSTSALGKQRDAMYAVDSAVNNAIQLVKNDGTRGVAPNNGSCGFDTGATGVNQLDVNVQCATSGDSGASLGSSTAPPFAILTLAPFTEYWDAHGYNGGNTYPGCSSVSTAPNAELGVVQVQNAKALTVKGDVYVNSDVDSDTWTNGCPNISAARAIQVDGNVIVHEGCHDMFAVVGRGWYCDQNGQTDQATQGDAGRAPTGGFASAPGGLSSNLVDPAVANAAAWAPNITTAPPAQSVPTCPQGLLVTFQPGTYTDAAGLTSLMNGTTCPGRLFWFAPGNYYFDFGNNSGAWTINDPTARIVGGAANAVPVGATPVGPLTVTAASMASTATSNPGYSTTGNARLIGETPTALSATATFNTTNQTRWITSTGYTMSPQIPGGSSGITVNARIVHSETFGAPSQIGALQLQVRNQADNATLCTVDVPPSATSGASTDVSIPLPAGCGLDEAALNTGSFSLRYLVTHSACGGPAPAPACANVTSTLDGVELKVSYTAPARAAWDPADPTTVTANSPSVPGACIHDGDYGFSPTTGVQFVFGGNSHVSLLSGAWELCPSFSSTHQEIVMYGVKAGGSGSGPQTLTLTPTSAAPGSGTWTPNTNNYAAAKTIDGQTVSTSVSGNPQVTRTFALSGFAPATAIPAGSTNVSVTARVAHRESSTTRFDSQQITITPASGTGCTVALNDSTSLTPETPNVNCLDVGEINSGLSVTYSVRYNCSSQCGTARTAELDGVQLVVTYTPPVVAGSLKAQSGCIVQVPYYNPTSHAPGYNGACALFSIASDANGGRAPRLAAFWGTVYAPSSALDVQVDVLSVPVFDRGVVVRMLMLGYNVAANASVPISSTPITANVPANRRMTFTAQAPGMTTKVVAEVEFCDTACDATHAIGSTKIWSWTVTR